MKIEYITISKATKKAYWYKKFIVELGVMPLDAITLYYENNGAIALARKLRSHQKSKHIEWQFHIIRDYLKKNFIEV